MGGISGFASLIPISYSEGEGFEMCESADESITQDFKCILLSNGKIMDTDFGCNLKRFLFENPQQIDFGAITTEIHSQVSKYLDNYLKVIKVEYFTDREDPSLPPEALIIKIQAQSKITGAPIPVGVFVDTESMAIGTEMASSTFTGNYHNWYLTEK